MSRAGDAVGSVMDGVTKAAKKDESDIDNSASPKKK